ncbi:MAG: hypothetical protein COT35_13095 [Nitrospirae bacterium CG08_land_8_20_14_0_20_52_24]|nr:MAG: hypothetical protein COT35_13095 [Nitrospirae bacterium CG08_land_8_20_14_0_20_52_24]PIV82829.1 MAG: hypothetical protein COW52_11685 [Nitrospirae bacterium CG17_big_fil_post_rev_8_21_14_2_50_50_9]PIX85132.1 MAG: hypothetical protein COZ32_10060 [Nitrospirae bacterium CG_4_10_14_3_um_filter_53_41]
MSLKSEILEHLRQFHTAPFLFVGSGLPRRYLGIDDWTGLLRRMSALTDRPYEYYRASGDGKEPQIATEIAKDLHIKWWDSDKFAESRENFKSDAINKESALKIEIAKLIEKKSECIPEIPGLQKELETLQNATIDGIITTNWDLLLEGLFPDYKKFIGQEELLFSSTQAVGEIYKIHGCCTSPNSLIVTAGDYKSFRTRNPYLAAKLLTIFVEHPIFFLGYSLSDPNVSQILGSIASCLTSTNIDQLRDRLILVNWEPDRDEFQINDTNIITEKFNIPVKIISTSQFTPIFEALCEVPRKFPARMLRRLKQHVYNLVQDNDPDNHLYVVDIDNESDLSMLDVVFGVGVRIVDDPNAPCTVRLGNDPNAPTVRLSSDPEAPELPYRMPTTADAYESVQEQLLGAVRAWKTDPLAHTPQSELLQFYVNRHKIKFDESALTCMLVSSLYRGCPVHYWAKQLGRDALEKVLDEEIGRDQHPGISVAARLAFALGLSAGENILDKIAKRSKYTSARILAGRLRRALDEGANIWTEYRTPVRCSVKIGDEIVAVDLTNINNDRNYYEHLINQLLDQKKTRALAKRIDALVYGHI